jgi:hypothetical protein
MFFFQKIEILFQIIEKGIHYGTIVWLRSEQKGGVGYAGSRDLG